MFNFKNKYATKEDLQNTEKLVDQIQQKLQGFESSINELSSVIVNAVETIDAVAQEVKQIKKHTDGLKKTEPVDFAPYINSIKNINNKIDQNEVSNKQIVEIITTLNKTSESLNNKIKSNEDAVNKLNSNLNDDLHKVNQKLDTSIEVLLDKIADNIADEKELPVVLIEDICPFKKGQGYCEIWASRKKKTDALAYCSPCLQSYELQEKGM